jgi:HlyD family secretion protein
VRRWGWPIGLSSLLMLALSWALWPRPIAVDLVTVSRGPMAVTIEDTGETRVREVYVISAPIAGRMLRIEVHAGDPIKQQETVIAMIEPSDPAFRDARAQRELEYSVSAAKAARDFAAANLKGKQAELRLAQQDLERTQQLFAKGIVARAPLERAEAQVEAQAAARDTAEAAVRQRQFEVSTAEASLILPSDSPHADKRCCFAIRAPITGQMLRLVQENEGVVQIGTPLAEVGDPTQLEVVLDLLSSAAVQVQEGDAALITRWGGEFPLNARVRRIEPVGITKVSSLGIAEQRVNVILDLTDPPEHWKRLGHGYQVDVAIIRWQAANVLRVPIGALFREGSTWAVFRLDGNRARTTTITLGQMNDEVAEVRDGLNDDDMVITHPGEKVADGVTVTGR